MANGHPEAARRLPIALAPLALLAACATYREYEPVVDMAGHTKAAFDYDLLVCRENAKELDVLRGLPFGVIGGAALGSAAAAAAGGSVLAGTATGAAGGAIAGAAAGSLYGRATTAITGRDPHTGEIRQCLQARGYTLLDPDPLAPPTPAPLAPNG
jgi:hypothetical protein